MECNYSAISLFWSGISCNLQIVKGVHDSSMTGCDFMVAARLSNGSVPCTYLGWNTEKYLSMHSVSLTSRSGGIYPSRNQTTTDVFQIEGATWSLYTRPLIPLRKWALHLGHNLQSMKPSAHRWRITGYIIASYGTIEPHCARGSLTLQQSSATSALSIIHFRSRVNLFHISS